MFHFREHDSCNRKTTRKLLSLIHHVSLYITADINFLQIRFLMKSYSFIRETAPVVMKNTPKEGTVFLCSVAGVFIPQAYHYSQCRFQTLEKND